MKAGIVGLPNVGKSTLFNCLSDAKAQSANYPFCTIEPNLGVIQVPDKRLTRLEKIVCPDRVKPADVEIVDIAGLVRGASKGEGLGNQFLANIRETQAIIHVLRCFENENITHVENTIDPIRDKEIIDTELQLKDLETLEKRLSSAHKKSKYGNKEALQEVQLIQRLIAFIEQGKNIRDFESTDDEKEILESMMLLTDKPVLYVCNVSESEILGGNQHIDQVREMIKSEDAEILIMTVETEAQISDLDSYEERKFFLNELGLKETGVNRLIRKTYDLLNLQTFFTAGKKEVRAWTIKKGTLTPQAAGVIHSDFEKGFIRAEVIPFDDYVRYGSESKVKDAGKMRVEGKEYVISDGDVVHFRVSS